MAPASYDRCVRCPAPCPPALAPVLALARRTVGRGVGPPCRRGRFFDQYQQYQEQRDPPPDALGPRLGALDHRYSSASTSSRGIEVSWDGGRWLGTRVSSATIPRVCAPRTGAGVGPQRAADGQGCGVRVCALSTATTRGPACRNGRCQVCATKPTLASVRNPRSCLCKHCAAWTCLPACACARARTGVQRMLCRGRRWLAADVARQAQVPVAQRPPASDVVLCILLSQRRLATSMRATATSSARLTRSARIAPRQKRRSTPPRCPCAAA